MVYKAWDNMICPVCKGTGYHVTHNRTNYKDKDEWGVKFFLGYRFKICKRCHGKGELGDLIVKLTPWELEDEMLELASKKRRENGK